MPVVYTPNPVQIPPKIEPTYDCYAMYGGPTNWNSTVSGPWWHRNTSPDPYQYIGDGMVCMIVPTQNISDVCESCRINCGFQGKTCSDNCYCRW